MVVTEMVTATPVELISLLMIWISKGELLPRILLDEISKPWMKVRALMVPLKLVLNGSRMWISLPETHPLKDPAST